MDLDLTDDQLELQRLVREVARAECPPALVRTVAEGRGEAEVAALWKTFVGLDWPTLTVPVDAGGMGLGAVELAVVAEELGAVADPTPLLATTSQYVAVLRECGEPDLCAPLLAEVCTGTTGAASFDAGDLRAVRDGGRWSLSGTVRHVIDGDRAQRLALVADTGDGEGVFVVDAAAVEAVRTPIFDATVHLADVTLDGAEPAAEVVGDGVAERVERARREAVTCLAASMVGASQRILDLTLDHVRERQQFGQPIGAFQAVKHMAVDVYVAIERARILVHFAALTLAEGDHRSALAASMAKAAAGDCQRIAVRHGIQLFGGLGYTWENDLHLFVRRAKVGEPLLGSTAEHRAAAAALHEPRIHTDHGEATP